MKAVIYVRLSEEDKDKKNKEDDSESIANQKALLLQFAANNGFDVSEIYSDDDYRGSDRSRPEWNRLLTDAKNRKFDIILCKTQSRFTREMEMVEKYIHHYFPMWGIRFIGVADHADTANKGNKKQRQIMGLTNEWYLEDMSDSIKAALTVRREQGLHIGSFPLYGYKKDPNNKGKLLVDPEAAKVVRDIFNMYAEGYGKTGIARNLNARGIPNATEYKRLTGISYKTPKHKNGTLWKYSAIADILANEAYIGNMVQGKYGSVSYKSGVNKPRPKDMWIRVENTHEPIIDIELWERVQSIISQRAKPFATGKVGIFSRKAVCMYCGYAMNSSKSRGKHYLKCGTKRAAKDACIGSFIAADSLSQCVIEQLNALLAEYLSLDELNRNVFISDNTIKRIAKLEDDRKACYKKISEFSDAVKTLYLDKTKGIISDKDFISFSADFTYERERFECIAKTIDSELYDLKRKQGNERGKADIINEFSRVNKLDRVMVEKLIDKIRVGKRDKTSKLIPVEINWIF